VWGLVLYAGERDNSRYHHASLCRVFRVLSNGNLNILPKQNQEPHQPLERKTGEATTHQSGNLALVNAEDLRSFALGSFYVPGLKHFRE
jgi:hypothetical protein